MWRIPQDEIGHHATEMLMQRIKDGGKSLPSKQFTVRHIRGRTVGKPSRGAS